MSSNVRVLASTATAAGYRLAGLTVVEVGSPALTTGRLDEIASDADVKIILIEQRLLDAVPAAVRRAVDRRAVPVIVPIPAPNFAQTASGAESYIVELLRRAIGYRVRLQ